MDGFERMLAYVEKLPPAISGSQGHNATFRVACECVRRGLSESEAYQVLRWYNEHRCQPLWSEKELDHKIQSAFRVEKPLGVAYQRSISDVIDDHLKRPKFALPGPAPELPVYLRSESEEESWWAAVFAERGIPDPVMPL